MPGSPERLCWDCPNRRGISKAIGNIVGLALKIVAWPDTAREKCQGPKLALLMVEPDPAVDLTNEGDRIVRFKNHYSEQCGSDPNTPDETVPIDVQAAYKQYPTQKTYTSSEVEEIVWPTASLRD
ncbi:MAG: hypothetical protein U5K77_02385 [Candidatus Saccharibacteria bacterium]|nr:hypothetical protein [Candidatus Saccharibacteria bacterium]